jgi:hypothetical protein
MQIGFAQIDITPVPTTDIPAGFMLRPMVDTHDPLWAVACVISDGKTNVALVGIDAGVIRRSTTDAARKAIANSTNIPGANVMISASHTHQGGQTLTLFNHVADPAYADRVARAIADAVTQAWKTRREAQLAHATGQVEGIHFNRRFKMRDGREVTHPGKLHPDIIAPAGPVDPDVGILLARSPEGALIGAVVHFGCHATVTEGGNTYSADYIYYFRKHLCERLGAEIPVVFLQGACGDVTQVNNLSSGTEGGHDYADMMGQRLAQAAYDAITDQQNEENALIAATTEYIPIRIREDDERDRPTLGLGSGAKWQELYDREAKFVADMRRSNPVLNCEIQAIRIGQLGIVTSGAELFCQPSLDIKHASRFERTWVVTRANEYLGYVPTGSAFYAGGYEPTTARSSFLAPDAAQKVVEASLHALANIKAAS